MCILLIDKNYFFVNNIKKSIQHDANCTLVKNRDKFRHRDNKNTQYVSRGYTYIIYVCGEKKKKKKAFEYVANNQCSPFRSWQVK